VDTIDIAPNPKILYATYSGCVGKTPFALRSSGMKGKNNGTDPHRIPKKRKGFPFSRRLICVGLGKIERITCFSEDAM
jgi:hypothetical protein